jgi:imidazolonepropionase-like amidohydrolase
MRIAITDVRVFDGERLLDPGTVVVDGGRIGTDATGAEVVDGRGGVLLPGLIDAHVHLRGPDDLARLVGFGVTTALDMAGDPARIDPLRGGRPDIRSAGIAAAAPGGPHSMMPGFPREGLLSGPEEAPGFVAARVADGSDYLKMIAERPALPGLSGPTLTALVAAAHSLDRLTVVHAAAVAPWVAAVAAGSDVVTHTPMDGELPAEVVAELAARGGVAVPTLSMMEAIVARMAPPGLSYANARAAVGALHRAGVPVLAGTDANSAPGAPAAVSHGDSLHHELELLVDAGLSTVEALRAATALPAAHFRLPDRGRIAAGLRADLLLVDGDPVADVRATRAVRRIWCAGTEVAPLV